MKQLYRANGELQTLEINLSEISREPVDASSDAWVIGFSFLKEFLRMPEDTKIDDCTKSDIREVIVCREGHLVAVLSRQSISDDKWECALEALPKPAREEFLAIAGEYVHARIVIRE